MGYVLTLFSRSQDRRLDDVSPHLVCSTRLKSRGYGSAWAVGSYGAFDLQAGPSKAARAQLELGSA